MTSTQLHERVVREWGRDIVSGDLPAGARISTDRAADRWGVSRTVVREAVRVLESMGLLASRRRLGITVLSDDHWNPFDPSIIRWKLAGRRRIDHLDQIAELRSAIEPLAARLAALRAGPADCGELTRAVIGLDAAARLGDDDAYRSHDLEFHRIVLRACGNPLMAGLTRTIGAGPVEGGGHEPSAAWIGPDAVRRHGELATSIQGGDPDGAERAMRDVVAAEHRISAAIRTPAGSSSTPARPGSAPRDPAPTIVRPPG